MLGAVGSILQGIAFAGSEKVQNEPPRLTPAPQHLAARFNALTDAAVALSMIQLFIVTIVLLTVKTLLLHKIDISVIILAAVLLFDSNILALLEPTFSLLVARKTLNTIALTLLSLEAVLTYASQLENTYVS